MGRVFKFQEFQMNESDTLYQAVDYLGKSTFVLDLTQEEFDKIQHLFDDKGKPKDESVKDIKAQGYVWSLHLNRKMQWNKYFVYGVSGDHTFGRSPDSYPNSARGNKKAAKVVFEYFVKKYL